MNTRFFNPLYAMLLVGVGAVVALVAFLYISNARRSAVGGELFVYCAAGMRYPVEKIALDYEKEFGVRVNLQYAGSNTLLNQAEVSGTGDLFLAADESYADIARAKGIAKEKIVIARIRPVIAVRKENTSIKSVADLGNADYRVALGNPEATAVGKRVRKLMTKSGHWESVSKNVTENGVFKPTVNEVANDVKLESVSAGVVWDSTVVQYPELKAIRTPELDAGESTVVISVLTSCERPSAALHFARYVSAKDRGLATFQEKGFETVEGDVWEDRPTLTFYAGSVNRRAIEQVVFEFAEREGVDINTVYNGCGILTADMRSIREGHEGEFPDVYMACDKYYLETVQEMFQPGAEVSSAAIVIVVAKGNPKDIRRPADLKREGVRVALGQPEQCTVGVLSRRLLQEAGVYDEVLENNVVTQTATSALLVPTVTTGSADAALAYVTDTLRESERIDVIKIDSERARAIQPFSISRASQHKRLAGRLFEAITTAQEEFEAAGFTWMLGEIAAEPSDAVNSEGS